MELGRKRDTLQHKNANVCVREGGQQPRDLCDLRQASFRSQQGLAAQIGNDLGRRV